MAIVSCRQLAGEVLVDGTDVERADLDEASEDVVPEGGLRQEGVHKRAHEGRLEDVAERDPVQELEQRLRGTHGARTWDKLLGEEESRGGWAAAAAAAAAAGRRSGEGAWKVQTSSVDLVELLMMNSHSWKMSEKSLLNDSLSFLALADVISSREKSNTSSDRSLRICARAKQAGPSGRGVGVRGVHVPRSAAARYVPPCCFRKATRWSYWPRRCQR